MGDLSLADGFLTPRYRPALALGVPTREDGLRGFPVGAMVAYGFFAAQKGDGGKPNGHS